MSEVEELRAALAKLQDVVALQAADIAFLRLNVSVTRRWVNTLARRANDEGPATSEIIGGAVPPPNLTPEAITSFNHQVAQLTEVRALHPSF